MTKHTIIDVLIWALEQKGFVDKYHKMLNGGAVQIKTTDGDIFNVKAQELDKNSIFVVGKLRK